MAKHTPGPWYEPHMCEPDIRCNCTYVLSEKYAGSICDISVDNGKAISQGGNDSPPLEEAIANAKLIAAAPELLDAVLDLKYKLYGNGAANPKIEALLKRLTGE